MKKCKILKRHGTVGGKPVKRGQEVFVEDDYQVPPWMELVETDVEPEAAPETGPAPEADGGDGVAPELSAARSRADALGVPYRSNSRATSINKNCDEAEAELAKLRKDADDLGIQWQGGWSAEDLEKAIGEALGNDKN